jgi:hypothetical protein
LLALYRAVTKPKAARLRQCSGMTPEPLARLGAVLRRFDDLDGFSRAVTGKERGRVLRHDDLLSRVRPRRFAALVGHG